MVVKQQLTSGTIDKKKKTAQSTMKPMAKHALNRSPKMAGWVKIYSEKINMQVRAPSSCQEAQILSSAKSPPVLRGDNKTSLSNCQLGLDLFPRNVLGSTNPVFPFRKDISAHHRKFSARERLAISTAGMFPAGKVLLGTGTRALLIL